MKAYSIENPDTFKLLEKYFAEGVSMSAALQRDTLKQKVILCEIIDAIGKPVYLHWSGVDVSVEDAKKYVMDYGK